MHSLSIPCHLSHWFESPKSILGSYYNHSKQLVHLNQLWKQQGKIALHSEVVNYHNRVLIIATVGAEWATYLHYNKASLSKNLRQNYQEFFELKDIKGIIKKPILENNLTATPLTESHVPTLSPFAKQVLHSVSETISHPELKAALYKLAKR
jgi:hypothetical protein